VFKDFVGRYAIDLDQTLHSVVDTLLPQAPEFGVMLRYALGWVDERGVPYQSATGKRLRPTLVLLCNEAAGGEWQKSLHAAAAVELLHNFSLIHDDIQDNSLTRHGRPTVWQHWGMANAINAGDAMFALAYGALEIQSRTLSAERVRSIWAIFNNTNLELTRGQHLDMRFEHLDMVSTEEYISMITGKSAALLATCAQLGALIATEDESIAQRYADFGLNIGIAFQIRDDILGIWGDPNITGKSTATDIIARKKSLPVLYGLAQSRELVDVYLKTDFDTEDVTQAVRLLDDTGAQQYAREQERSYFERAMSALLLASPQGEAGQRLRLFVEALFNRDY